MKPWPEFQVSILRNTAPLGIAACLDALPGKTEGAIFTKASSLGVKIAKVMEYDRFADELTNKRWAWANRIAPFLVNVNGCMELRGVGGSSYGQIRLYAEGIHRTFTTHRIALEVSSGQLLPEGAHCCHRCDNPRCNNPGHLFAGSPKDNGADRHAKGRTRGRLFANGQTPPNIARGAARGCAKLTEAEVREIRAIHASGAMGHKLLARKYGVSPPVIAGIVKRTAWTHVP